MSDRDRFQGLCLVNDAGYKYMVTYDHLSPEIRRRLRESPFNLCTECVAGAGPRYSGSDVYERAMLRQIEVMENMLREQDREANRNAA